MEKIDHYYGKDLFAEIYKMIYKIVISKGDQLWILKLKGTKILRILILS